MKTVRAFIAVQLPEEARSVLDQVSQDLAGQVPPRTVRWVRPDRIHLTLRFLGETELAKLSLLGEAMDELASHAKPFELQLSDMGCFPNRKRPRVIWVGVEGDVKTLQTLKASLDDALVDLGWASENRPYRAHLTLGRIKDSRKLTHVDWQAEVTKVTVPVKTIHLIESQLTPTGPIYTVRHASHLGAG